jgi:hypothetical protein
MRCGQPAAAGPASRCCIRSESAAKLREARKTKTAVSSSATGMRYIASWSPTARPRGAPQGTAAGGRRSSSPTSIVFTDGAVNSPAGLPIFRTLLGRVSASRHLSRQEHVDAWYFRGRGRFASTGALAS